MTKRPHLRVEFIVFLLLAAWILIGAVVEFYQIGWGTGVWLGQFALTWFLAFLFFILFCILCLLGLVLVLWQPHRLERLTSFLVLFRDRLRALRWPFVALLLLIPIYLLQYTFWGVVLHGLYLRILLVTGVSLLVGSLITSAGFIRWNAFLVSLILVAASLSFFVSFINVTSHPFSLGWSEGNRLWDYSVLFGREVYNYPADKEIPVFLDIGRQFAGGIPFLIPGIKIWQARLWLAFVDVVPYLVLGWIAFHMPRRSPVHWILVGVWAFLFVKQGPIHPPLMICAIVVALAWRRSLWLAIPMVFAAGYFAQVSRYTWLFAPAMWSVMLEFAGARELNWNVWRRSLSVGIAGVMGGYLAPVYVPILIGWFKTLGQSQPVSSGGSGTGGVGIEGVGIEGAVSISNVQTGLSSQPLLWSRLLPNDTYGPGILFGLVMAVAPLILVLIYLVKTRQWQLHGLQKVSLVLPLLAFLLVGLIISVKIGGGGDLHNLDMFIIGLMFAAALAWRNGQFEWSNEPNAVPVWMRVTMAALIIFPAFKPLTIMRPLSINTDLQLVATLADITPIDPLPDPLPDTIASRDDTRMALEKLQKAVRSASAVGEVLFMDQRQLLTFGHVDDIPLVPEYDKKLLIDMAMGNEAAYFDQFYTDLASHRFALIVSSPLNRRLDQDEGNFGEENNAWVKWVAGPLLCYYQPLDVLKKVDVALFVPRTEVIDCSDVIPR